MKQIMRINPEAPPNDLAKLFVHDLVSQILEDAHSRDYRSVMTYPPLREETGIEVAAHVREALEQFTSYEIRDVSWDGASVCVMFIRSPAQHAENEQVGEWLQSFPPPHTSVAPPPPPVPGSIRPPAPPIQQ